MFYNSALVDKEAKLNCLEIIVQYESAAVTQELGFVFLGIVKKHSLLQESTQSPDLDSVISLLPEERVFISDFYGLIAEKAIFDNFQKRRADGVKKLNRFELLPLILPILTERRYALQANTWAAICEEWLQICSLVWVKNGDNWLYESPPSDEEGVMRWLPMWVAHINYFY